MKEFEVLNLVDVQNPILSHFHKFYVIGFIQKGSRRMLCNGMEYLLNPGDTVVFNPYDVHQCEKSGKDLMEYYSININVAFVKNLFSDKLPNFQNVIKASNLFPCFLKSLKDKKAGMKILKNIPHSFEKRSKDLTVEIDIACKIIEQNLSNKITLEFLSSSVGLSKSALLRAFVETMGITPYKYIESLRINKAKEFFLNGLSFLDTAHTLGFSSQSHFINSFKSYTGLTPGAYRKCVCNG